MPKLSRYLNEKQALMGLSIEDMLIIILSFTAVDGMLADTPYKLISFIYLIGITIITVTLRFKTRRKIIRDNIFNILKKKEIHDPKY